MKEQRFNLCDEKWIKVILLNGTETELSIRDVFRRAHEILTLSGETDLQNTALLRFLIAFNVAVLYRYDTSGKEHSLEDANMAIERFREVWKKRSFSEEMFVSYIDKWHDRFYLIGGERPFYQVPEKYVRASIIKKDKKNPTGIQYLLDPFRESDKPGFISTAAMNGEILESANSPSPFANKCGVPKETMTFAEASRWLIHYMAFADCSSKIPGKWNAATTFPSAGANVHPIGKNLFQTIMLCSVLLNSNRELYNVYDLCGKRDKNGVLPAWEMSGFNEISSEPYGDGFPENIPELYTQQSRKVILYENTDSIIGAFVAAGDKFGRTNAFIEPMFSFVKDKKDKSGLTSYPSHIKKNNLGWNEFEKIFGGEERNVYRWVNTLFDEEILPDDINVPFSITDISYGSMSCGVEGTYSSGIVVNKKFFKDSLEMDNVKNEVKYINKLSNALGALGRELDRSQGQKEKDAIYPLSNKICDMFEKRMSEEFNKYLAAKLTRDELKELEFKIAYQVADDVLKDIGMAGYYGHGDMSAGVAENKFRAKIYGIKKERGMLRESEEEENAG